MNGFSGILFNMQPLNPDVFGCSVTQIDRYMSFSHNGIFKLADLIPLR